MTRLAPRLLRSRSFAALLIVLTVGLLVVWSMARAQSRNYTTTSAYGEPTEFYFTRLQYQSANVGGFRGRGGSWRTDYDDAEVHLTDALSRLTRMNVSPDGQIVDLNDDTVMDYPWLYAVEVGNWYLDDQEAARLREYLLRGGFLMVDDFHGLRQWEIFRSSMSRVFPDRPIIEIPETDALLHVLYDLDQRIQIPGRQFINSGRTWEQPDDTDPGWRGIYDEEGRLMVAINYNMDLGDAWEHADDPWYPEEFTGLAYRFAVNYVIYSMTH